MAQISVSDEVKAQLKVMKEEGGHTSVDSVLRTLIERSQMTDDYRYLFDEWLSSGGRQTQLHGDGVDMGVPKPTPGRSGGRSVDTDSFDNEPLAVIQTLPFHAKLLLQTIFAIEKSAYDSFISGDTIFEAHVLLAKEIGVDLIPWNQITDLVSALDILGVVAAEITVSGNGTEVINVETTVDDETIQAGLAKHRDNLEETSPFDAVGEQATELVERVLDTEK